MATTNKRKSTVAKKSSKKTTEEPKAKGRPSIKNGLQDKMDWVDRMYVAKGKTRPEAIEGLLEKYPDITENYAKTIVYSYMKDDYEWPSARGKGTKKKATSSTTKKKTTSTTKKKSTAGTTAKKKTAPVKKKRAVKVEEEDDDFGDF